MGILGGGYEYSAPVSVLAVSPLHAGSGRSLGLVDLPIQRDGLGYPVVWGSSFKGALRGAVELSSRVGEGCVNILFGQASESGESYAGSVYVSDLHPLVIPGSCSLGSCYFTSPRLLDYFSKVLDVVLDVDLVSGVDKSIVEQVKSMTEGLLEETSKTRKIISGNQEVIGEENFVNLAGTYVSTSEIDVFPDVGDLFAEVFRMHYPESVAKGLADRVVVLPEHVARVMFRSRLLVKITRVALDYRTKTVKRGALWTEEYIPEGSILSGVFLFSKPRGRSSNCDIGESADSVVDLFRRAVDMKNGRFHLIIGGHETIGKGLVEISLIGGGGR